MLIFFFCDRSFKLNGIWPNLEEAKKSNQRIFAFVRVDNELEIKYLGDKIIPEIKVKKDDIDVKNIYGSVKILSTYSAINIGSKCKNLVNEIEKACKMALPTHFNKLAIFSNLGKNLDSCLWTLARNCNSKLEDAVQKCKNGRSEDGRAVINFLQSDYPNYPGPLGKTNVEIAYEENLKTV